MKWKRTQGDEKQGEAISDAGFRMTWSSNARGTWHNAWTPEPGSRVVAAGYDKAEVKAACERHAKRAEVAA